MQQSGFTPRSMLIVGVGVAPEFRVWNQVYSDVPKVAIDAKANLRGIQFPYIQAVATDCTEPFIQFCWKCKSPACLRPELHKEKGKWQAVPTVRIDEIPRELLPPPTFIWMDIEGSEIPALRGAERTLEQTAYICIELVDWVSGHASRVDRWLQSRGFEVRQQFVHDALYERMTPLEAVTL